MAEGGQRRIVTVLITDVVGSTTIGERLGPERSKALFDELARLVRAPVERFEGTVAQLTGDGVLALFGVPTAHEDDPARAVRAALAIQEAVQGYAAEIAAAYEVELSARAGVNTGPVVVPDAHGPAHEIYNALGDTVNVAARLQEAAGPGGVAVGPETARQIDSAFELEPLGDLELKGKLTAVAAYRVVAPRVAAGRTGVPFVARELELGVLTEELARLAEGRGSVVAISGEPGIGKSRLVAEARSRVGTRVRFLEGGCVDYARDVPYQLIRDVLRSWLGLGVSDPEARVRLELKAELSGLLGEGVAETYPFLANLLGVTLDDAEAERLRSFARDSVQRQTHEAVTAVVAALADGGPVCLVLEDLHWADEPTLALVEELLPAVEEAAVAFVLVHRSEPDQESWNVVDRARRQLRHRFIELELAPLTTADCATLAASAAGAPLSDDVAAALAERAGGNPFFVEEALHDLLERGLLRRVNAHLALVEDADATVPTLVQEALQARLDRLAPDTRELVSVAAVTGRTFGLPLLERLVTRDRLRPALSELQRLDLVVEERRQPALEYRFRHGLVQEAAYAGLTSAGRRALHRRVAEALEELAEEAPEQVYTDLARHYAEADDPAKAADYLLRAGDAARAVYADREAAGHYRRALAFLDRLGDDERARHTLYRMAQSHLLAFEFEAAGAAWEEAAERPEPPALRLDPTERVAVPGWEPRRPPIPGHAYLPSSTWLATHLFRGLFRIAEDFTAVPELAERVAVSPDGLEYRFTLRRGLTWSDGRELTAADFAFTFREMQAQGVSAAHLLDAVEDADAVDDTTLRLRLTEARPYVLYVLGQSFAFPWPRHAVGADWPSLERAVYSGPYRLAEHDADHALLVGNEQWRGARRNVGEIHVVGGRNLPDQIADLRAGRLDLLVNWASLPLEGVTARVEPSMTLSSNFVTIRERRPPLDDVRVRRAIAHALDAERIRSTIYPAEAPARGGVLPPAMPGHSHDLGLPFDLDLARTLLADAGYPGGAGLPELEVVVMGYPQHPDAHEFVPTIVEPLAAVGIRAQGYVQSPTAGNPPDADILANGWIADFPDPDGFLASALESELARKLIGPRVRTLIAEARATRDRDGRLARFRELDRYVVAEGAHMVPVGYGGHDVLVQPWLEGLWVNALTWATLDEVVVRR